MIKAHILSSLKRDSLGDYYYINNKRHFPINGQINLRENPERCLQIVSALRNSRDLRNGMRPDDTSAIMGTLRGTRNRGVRGGVTLFAS